MSEERRRYARLDLVHLVTTELPREWVAEAITVVSHLMARTDWNNRDRREYAVGTLLGDLHCEEHKARCLVELAVLFVKARAM